MAGFSKKSFCGSANVVINCIDNVKHKFQSVYIISHGSNVKLMSTDAYNACKIIKENDLTRYAKEIELNRKLGKVIDKIIRSICKENKVHLLGKCAGGGVAIQTVTLNDIYTGLYLAVPSSPNNVDDLKKLGDNRIKTMVFRYAWQDEDPIEFLWGKCKDQVEIYNKTMSKLKAVNYKFGKYSGDKHEIPSQLFTELILI
jgi:dienelactone hydrolase